jgi:nitrate/TMAO reductase-like tetraheme cytochrome c subunit
MRLCPSVLLLAIASVGLAAPPKAAPAPKPPAMDDCLACHDDKDAKRADGTSIAVSKEKYLASVHGAAGAVCIDCHADLAKTTDFPHPEKLAKVECRSCHEQEGADYDKSAHAASRKTPGKAIKAARCVDCHGDHDILPSKDPASATNHFNLPATCLKCHSDPAFPVPPGESAKVPARFRDSIHGKALELSGLSVAPNCATCHGAHAIRRPQDDPSSPAYRTRIPATCGKCHGKIVGQYEEGVHGTAMKGGNGGAPVCTDCHSAHRIDRANTPSWQLSVIEECGTCHEHSLKTYRDTYHGQVTDLGFSRIATCAACHEPHRIFPVSDPRSSVSPGRRVETCGKCHAGATASFAKYDPHADPHDRARNPMLHWTSVFMRWLLIGVFAFFGIHTALWFPRSYKVRSAGPPASGDGPKGEGR